MKNSNSGPIKANEDIIEYLEKVHDSIEVILPILKNGIPIADIAALKQCDQTPEGTIPHWMSLDDVCNHFKLAKNNIKSRAWRIKRKFPFHQDSGPYSAVVYNKEEVEEWLKQTQTISL